MILALALNEAFWRRIFDEANASPPPFWQLFL